MKILTRLAAVIAFAVLPGLALAADDFYDHHVALQVSDNDPGTMTKVLNVATNMVQSIQEGGETVEIRIVAFNAGLHLLRTDTSPELDRVKSFGQSMPNVKFEACGNTIAGMTKKEGKAPPIIESAVVVPAGAIELMELQEDGWTVLRP